MNVTTLAEARDTLMGSLEDGSHCPCCDQWAKVYKRRLNSTMVRSLIWLVGESAGALLRGGDGWIDVPAVAPKWVTKTNQHATLRWWGLAERRPPTDGVKKHSGIWRPTPLGCDFALGRRSVPAHLFHYNNRVLGYGDVRTTAEACLGVGFDYEATMAACNVQGEATRLYIERYAPIIVEEKPPADAVGEAATPNREQPVEATDAPIESAMEPGGAQLVLWE